MFRLLLIFIFHFMSAVIPASFSDCPPASLHQHFSFSVGMALDTEKLKYSEKYWQLAIKEYNSFTPERILKPSFIQPKEGKFSFGEINELMRFCKERKIRLHGHTLLWHRDLPLWMQRKKGSLAELTQMMRHHIDTLVKHCATQVAGWDVVNEAFNDDGSLRETMWLKKIGPSYIAQAFETAGTADPTALLFYNDYGLEVPGPKLDAVLQHFLNLRQQGIRVDGIGLQMHISLESPTAQELKEACRKISEAGFRIHFSEVDVRLNTRKTAMKKTAGLLEKQSERYRFVFELFQSLPAKQQYGITLWGLSDGDSWLSEDSPKARPLLFDKNFVPKPAYCDLIKLGSRRN